MSIDQFLDRQRAPGYDCASFARDVWLDLTGVDLADAVPGLLAAQFVGRIPKATRQALCFIAAPIEPCLVVMRRPRSSLHIGVYVRGKVLHLKDSGVEYQRLDLAALTFKTVQFSCLRNS